MRRKAGRTLAGLLGVVSGVMFLVLTIIIIVMVFGNSVSPEYSDLEKGSHPLATFVAILQAVTNLLFFVVGGRSFTGRGKLSALIGGAISLICGVSISIIMSNLSAGIFHYIGILIFLLIAWLQWVPGKRTEEL